MMQQNDSPTSLIVRALERTVDGEWRSTSSIEDIATALCSAEDMEQFANVLAVEARAVRNADTRGRRNVFEYAVRSGRPADALAYAEDGVPLTLDPATVLAAMRAANTTLELLKDVTGSRVDIFELLGLRNLSGFVGEVFKAELAAIMEDVFQTNPHQDGYPDLMAITRAGAAYVREAEREGWTSDKAKWSPYPYGGVEVKATCGTTPAAKVMPKPRIGETRAPLLTGLDWKAHHRKTNNLLSVFWDFVDELPTLIGAFYRNDLTEADWGKVVKPKEGGGNTTSVSIMNRGGVQKMGAGWLVLPADEEFRQPLETVLGLRARVRKSKGTRTQTVRSNSTRHSGGE